MSRDTAFRLFFNNEPAGREALDRVETITVEQEAGIAWQARLEMPVCLDARGRWQGMDENLIRNTSRVRVEISVRGGPFEALIDGPVVDFENPMHAQPGRSTVTLTISDDSVNLNQREIHFDSRVDNVYELVEAAYSGCEQIESTDIDDRLRDTAIAVDDFRQNGTTMQVLYDLARCLGRHAYILPGSNPGTSVGCFQAFPDGGNRRTATDALPEMVLLGEHANIDDLSVRKDFGRPGRYQGARLNMADKQIDTQTASYSDHEPLGGEGALTAEESPADRRIGSGTCAAFGLDELVDASSRESGFAFAAGGNVREGCYHGVLQPYRLVSVRAGGTPHSGDYVITQVTHTLSRSNYTQSFRLSRNGRSEETNDRAAAPGKVF